MTVYNSPNCHRCGQPETLEHLLLQCTEIKSFWTIIQRYVNQITENKATLTDSICLFGYLRQKNDPLEQRTINLLNWTLSMAKAAIHHSVVDYRLHNITTSPTTLFKASVKSHINYQYKISKLRQQLYYFTLDWCIRDTYASVTNNTLVFNL